MALRTRVLEARAVQRATVERAELLAHTPGRLEFRTFASPAEMRQAAGFLPAYVERTGGVIEGRLCLDIVAAGALRVRYAEGAAVPENHTPMLVWRPGAPPPYAMHELDGCVEVTTARLRLVIRLSPYRLEIYDRQDGRLLCGVGGPEKSFFNDWDTYNTGLCRPHAGGGPLAVENFDLSPDEAIYGFGETFVKLNKVGQTLDLDVQDARGVATPRAYKNVPFFVSTRGYGVYFNHTSRLTAWVGSRCAADVQVALEDDFLDYFILLGSIKDVLASYTDLTGKGAVPPKWSFGYWQGKFSYRSADEALAVARQLRQHALPADVIHIDTHWFKLEWYCDLEFDPVRFPDPAAFIQELRALGFRLSLWQLPYLPSGSRLFDDLAAVDGFVRNAQGEIYDLAVTFVAGFTGVVGVIDFTNPRAVAVYQAALRRLLDLGVSVFKTDFGESAPDDGLYADGTPGDRMHNLYPLLYNRAVYEVTQAATGDGLVWSRSAWAGSQRYPVHWGGDSTSNFHNMVPQLVGGLSFGLSGFQFWSHDIGGSGIEVTDHLLIRWLQLGLFMSHSRIHGSGEREIYKFAPETVRICRQYLQLRYRLLPYLYGSARHCVAQSLPMVRALVIEYQDDRNLWDLGDEFLLGDSLLVAPIVTEHNGRQVYLPRGTWTDWWTGERLPGGRWISVEAGLETMPLYVREGGLIPLGPVMNYVDEVKTDRIELIVSLFEQDGARRFEVPVNDEVVPVQYTAADGQHRLDIGPAAVVIDVRVLGVGRLDVHWHGRKRP